MEELLKKAEKLNITVTEEITEEQLKVVIEKAEEEARLKAEEEARVTTKKEKKDKTTSIRVMDNNNKPISDNIENEKITTLGTKKNITVHNKKLKQDKNGEYYEELADGIGMWSRTGEAFLLKDLDK